MNTQRKQSIERNDDDGPLHRAAPAMYEALKHVEANLAGMSEENFEVELAHIRWALSKVEKGA